MKKKLLILISMLAMMFSLTACSNEVEKPFDYDDSQIVSVQPVSERER